MRHARWAEMLRSPNATTLDNTSSTLSAGRLRRPRRHILRIRKLTAATAATEVSPRTATAIATARKVSNAIFFGRKASTAAVAAVSARSKQQQAEQASLTPPRREANGEDVCVHRSRVVGSSAKSSARPVLFHLCTPAAFATTAYRGARRGRDGRGNDSREAGSHARPGVTD